MLPDSIGRVLCAVSLAFETGGTVIVTLASYPVAHALPVRRHLILRVPATDVFQACTRTQLAALRFPQIHCEPVAGGGCE